MFRLVGLVIVCVGLSLAAGAQTTRSNSPQKNKPDPIPLPRTPEAPKTSSPSKPTPSKPKTQPKKTNNDSKTHSSKPGKPPHKGPFSMTSLRDGVSDGLSREYQIQVSLTENQMTFDSYKQVDQDTYLISGNLNFDSSENGIHLHAPVEVLYNSQGMTPYILK
jgi:hypothetical protein